MVVSEEDSINYRRLDQYLSDKLESHSRSAIKELYKQGLVQSNDCKLELKKMVQAGTRIVLSIPEKAPCDAQAEDLPLDILFQDEHLVIVNKEAGMVTHPAPGNLTGTLVNAILYHCPDIEGIGDQVRPGIVHRLDKGTSGVMVIAKNQKAHQGLVELFSKHEIDRIYNALVLGTKIDKSGTITTMIGRHRTNRLKMSTKVSGGKEAITHYKVIGYYEGFSHLEIKLETGRTHQIRVHMSEILNRPIICDSLYGNPSNHIKHVKEEVRPLLKEYPHPLLHAKVLGFAHPITGEKLRFEVELPPIFKKVMEAE